MKEPIMDQQSIMERQNALNSEMIVVDTAADHNFFEKNSKETVTTYDEELNKACLMLELMNEQAKEVKLLYTKIISKEQEKKDL